MDGIERRVIIEGTSGGREVSSGGRGHRIEDIK